MIQILIVDTFLLSSSSKQLLSDSGIKLPSTILKTPLFNYISFCDFPAAKIINEIIKMVFGEEYDTRNSISNNLLVYVGKLHNLYYYFQEHNISQLCSLDINAEFVD